MIIDPTTEFVKTSNNKINKCTQKPINAEVPQFVGQQKITNIPIYNLINFTTALRYNISKKLAEKLKKNSKKL